MAVEEVIRLTGDASDAVGALDDLREAAQENTRGFDRMRGQVKVALGGLEKFSVVTAGVSGALNILKGAFNFAKESIEKYLRQVKEGDKLWESFERRIREVQGAFTELVLGTDNVQEGFERLSRVMDDIITIMDGVFSVIGPLVRVGFNALTGALSLAANAFRAFGVEADGVADDLQTARMSVDQLVGSMQDYETVIRNVVSQTREFRLATVESQIASLEQAAAMEYSRNRVRELGGNLADNQTAIQQMTAAIIDGTYEFQSFGIVLENGSTIAARAQVDALEALDAGFIQMGDGARLARRELETTWQDLTEEAYAAVGALDEVTESQKELDPKTDLVTTSLSEQAAAVEELTEEYVELSDALLRVFEIGANKSEQTREQLQLEIEAFQEAKEAQIALAEELYTAREERAATAFDRSVERTRAEAAEVQASIDAQNAARMQAAQSVANFAASASTDYLKLAASGEATEEATLNLLAGQLEGVGTKAIAEAAVLAFTPGAQGLAAGLGAAGIAAIVTAGQLRPRGGSSGAAAASAGPVSAGVAAPSGGGPSSMTNLTITNNFNGLVTDRRGTAREVAQVVQDAERFGYLGA